MRVSLVLAWGLFLVYAVWMVALQGTLAAPESLGEWTPDLGLLLLFVQAGRMPSGRGPVAALALVLARASLSAEPPALMASGVLAALGLFLALRTSLEIDRAGPRALIAGLAAWGCAHLWLAARGAAVAAESALPVFREVRLWPGALATALACLLLAPVLARLPGLAPLTRVRP